MAKKISKFVVAIVLCIATIIIGGMVVAKADQGNDDYEKATVLEANKKITSKLIANDDVDWYKFEVKESEGVFWAEFKTSDVTDTACFSMTLYYADEEGFPIDQLEYLTTDKYPENLTSQKYSYCKGDVVYVMIKKFSHDCVGKDYYLTMMTSTDPLTDCKWAVENDDTYENANVITSSSKLCGLHNTNKDEDWYKYEVQNSDEFEFIFKSTAIETRSAFALEMYEADEDNLPSKKLGYWTSDKFPEYIETGKKSFDKGTVIYIRIYRYSWDSRGILYSLAVKDTVDNEKTVTKLDSPYSILAGTNVVVGKAIPGSTVYVQIGKKKYSAKADDNGIYRVITSKLVKGKKVKIWQKVDKKTSAKITVKVVEEY